MAKLRIVDVPQLRVINTADLPRKCGTAKYSIDTVTLADGTEWYSKDVHNYGSDSLANEVLGYMAAKILDVPVPDFAVDHRGPNNFRWLTKVDEGWRSLSQLGNRYSTVVNSEDFARIACLQGLLGITDSHDGNYLVNPEGRMRKIDCEFMFDALRPYLYPKGLARNLDVNPEPTIDMPAFAKDFQSRVRDNAPQLYHAIKYASEYAGLCQADSWSDSDVPFELRANKYIKEYLAID